MMGFLLTAILALALIVHYQHSYVAVRRLLHAPVLIEPLPALPNADCATGEEDWSEFELGCNDRLSRLI